MYGMNQKTLDKNYFERGLHACKNNDLDDAKTYFNQIMHEKAGALALNHLASLYEKKEDIENMMDCLQKAANKSDIIALNELGIMYAKQGDLEKAKDCFLQMKGKKRGRGLYNLALVYCKMDDLKKAKVSFRKALNKGCRKALKSLVALCNRQELVKQLENIDHPYALVAMNNLGVEYYRKHKDRAAREIFFLAASKGLAAAMYNMGMMYHKDDNKADAIKCIQLAIENDGMLDTNGYTLKVIE